MVRLRTGVEILTVAATLAAMATPAEAQGPSCAGVRIPQGWTATKAAEIFDTTKGNIVKWNPETVAKDPRHWLYEGDTLWICQAIGSGFPYVIRPGATPIPDASKDKNVASPGSSPEYPTRLMDGVYKTFAPNEELWVALGPDQFDEQHNRIGLQVEIINGRPDSMQGLVFAPDRVPAVVSWFKTQGDMPAPTAQLLTKRSNNGEDWNKIGADFGNLWFRDPVTGKYQPWLLRLKNAGREGAGPVAPVTFRLGIKPFYQ